MNEKSDNKYNINIFNISYGLQENLGKKLENKIHGISERKDINKIFIDSSDISQEDNHMNYYEQFLESIKGESYNNENNIQKSKNSSPVIKNKTPSPTKKKFFKEEFKKRLDEQKESEKKNNHENFLCLQNNKDVSLENLQNSDEILNLNMNNIHSNRGEPLKAFRYKSYSSAKNLDDKYFLEDNKDKNFIKFSIHEVSKYKNDMNISHEHISTPKSHKHYSKQKKNQRHSTFLINEEHKKEKNDKKRIRNAFVSNEDNNNNNNDNNDNNNNNNNNNNINNNANLNKNINVFDINQFKKKKTLKIRKSEENVKKVNESVIVTEKEEEHYNNNFITNINNKTNNTKLNVEKKRRFFLCCIPIG